MAAVSLEQMEFVIDLPFVQVHDFAITESVNEHAKISLCLLVDRNATEHALYHMLYDKLIQIFARIDEKRTVLFIGYITNFEKTEQNEVAYLTLEAYSTTIKTDMVKRRRSFQSVNNTYAEVVKAVMLSEECGVLAIAGKETAICMPRIQYDETSWEFVKRLAGYLGTLVVSSSITEKPMISFGCMQGKTFQAGTIEQFQWLQKEDGISYRIHSYDIYRIGDRIEWSGTQYTVVQKSGNLKRGLLEFDYVLAERESCYLKETDNAALKGLALEGKVLSIKNQFLRLHLDIDEYQEAEQAFPYPYVPITGNIMYAMPEVGSKVALYFPDGKEEGAFIRTAFLEKAQDYPHGQIKCMNIPGGNGMVMEPENYGFFTVGKNEMDHSLFLEDETGLSLNARKEIYIEAGGNIEWKTAGSYQAVSDSNIMIAHEGTCNYVSLLGNQLTMSAEKFQASANNPKHTRKVTEETKICDSECYQEVLLAAIPSPVQGEKEQYLLAAIPQIINGAIKASGKGYYA